MIYIDRSRTDELSNIIKPDNAWFKLSEKETKVALKEKNRHKAKESIYCHVSVTTALEELFINKCAYCETPLNAGYSWEVEHFRPKGAVLERSDHPGYYWLTYTWRNLFPSCTFCNQKRKDKPTWRDRKTLPAKGKATQFPLVSESARAMSASDNIYNEHTLLIDPTYDEPNWYLGFDPKGDIFALNENQYGEKTIEVFNLKRRRLKTARQNHMKMINESLGAIDKVVPDNNKQKAKRAFLQVQAQDDKQYAGMVRCYAEILGFILSNRFKHLARKLIF